MFNRLIKNNNAAGGGCTDIVDNYDPFGGSGVALYQLNGDATDESGNYDGTWSGTEAYGTGVFGQAGSFNGSSEIDLNTSSLINNKSQITISTWVKFDNLNTQNFLVYQNDVNGSNQEFGFYDYGFGIIYFQPDCSTSNNRGYLSNTGLYVSNQWVHIVMVFDGIETGNSNRLKAYINGAEVSLTYDGTIPSTTGTPAQNLHLGGRGRSGSELNGSLDQVRIFNEALTPLEVEALYTEELCICDGTVDTLQILGDTSCIATYQLDGNANDLSGNYSGTPTDVSYGVGEFDLAGVFNGSSSRINLNSSVIGTNNNFTINVWIKTANSSQDCFIISSNDGGTGWYQMSASGTETAKVYAYRGANVEFGNITDIFNGNWRMLTMTFDNSYVVKAYLDGVFVNQGTGTAIPNSPDNLMIGCRRSSSPEIFFDGSIDQVRIFNKALSSSEVTTLYNETACTKVTRTAGDLQILGDTSCIANYRLDGDTTDLSGNYNASINLPNYTDGEFNFALLSTTSTVMTAPASLVGQNHSVSMWINPNSTLGTSYPYGQFTGGAFGRFFGTIVEGYIGVVSETSPLLDYTTTTNPLLLKQWNHVVWIKDSTYGWYFYVNNVLAGQVANTGNIYTGANTTFGTFANVNGSIDQIRVFTKVITAGEVTTLYNEGI